MISPTVQTDLDKAVAQMLAMTEARQVPFILSKAINDTAKDVQAEVQKNIPQRFTLRRQWIVQGIRVKPSTKANLEAFVYSRDDFMSLQETGGDKTPRGRYVAIPTSMVRRTPKDVIRKADRPKNLGDKAQIEEYRGNKFLALKKARRGKNGNQLRFLYLLVPRADIDERLKLREDGSRVAMAMFPRRLEEAIAYAMRTARR